MIVATFDDVIINISIVNVMKVHELGAIADLYKIRGRQWYPAQPLLIGYKT